MNKICSCVTHPQVTSNLNLINDFQKLATSLAHVLPEEAMASFESQSTTSFPAVFKFSGHCFLSSESFPATHICFKTSFLLYSALFHRIYIYISYVSNLLNSHDELADIPRFLCELEDRS